MEGGREAELYDSETLDISCTAKAYRGKIIIMYCTHKIGKGGVGGRGRGSLELQPNEPLLLTINQLAPSLKWLYM